MKTLYLHIGSPKTGTTTLQSTFNKNRLFLISKGFLYFDGLALLAHHKFNWGLRNTLKMPDNSDGRQKGSLAEIVKKYKKELKKTECHTGIISTEGLFVTGRENPQAPILIKEAFSEFDVKIVVYIRRQDKFIASNYVQAVKTFPFLKDDFETSVLSSLHTDTHNYYDHILPWEKAFGASNIIICPFERSRLKNQNIIDDFFAIVGIEDQILSQITQTEDTNISTSPECALFFQKLNILPINPTKRNSIYYDIMLFDSQKKKERKSLIRTEQRKAILQKYSKSNKKIEKKYLHGNTLFDERINNLSLPVVSDADVFSFAESVPPDLLTRIIFSTSAFILNNNISLQDIRKIKEDIQYFHDKTYDLVNAVEDIKKKLQRL